jgi:hypothetical protein
MSAEWILKSLVSRILNLYSESVSELLYDWRFTANQFGLAASPSRATARMYFFFQLNICGHTPYITSFLTRDWVCNLQFLLAIASAVIHGSKYRGTRNHTLLSQIRDFPFCRLLRLAGLPYLSWVQLLKGISVLWNCTTLVTARRPA